MEDNGAFIKSLFFKHGSLNVLSLLISTIGPIVCNILAGVWYGKEGLVAVALCAPLFFLAGFLGFVISGGASVQAAKAIARDDIGEAEQIYSAAIILSALAGGVVFGGLMLLHKPMVAFLTGDTGFDIHGFYMYSLLYAFFSVFIYIPLYFARVTGRNKTGLLLTVVMTAVTLASVPLMKLVMGMPAITAGQALGTITATVLCMALLRSRIRIVRPRSLYIVPIILAGSPMGLSRLYIFAGIFVLNVLLRNVGGAAAVAVFGVVTTLNRFISACTGGLSQTVVPLASVFHEERDFTSIRQLLITAYAFGNLLAVAVCLLLFCFGDLLCALFGLEVGALYFPLILNGAYVLLNLNASLLTAYYNSSGRFLPANGIPFLQDFVLLLLFAYRLKDSVIGVYAAFSLAYIAGFAVIFAWLLHYRRRNPDADIPFLFDRRSEKDASYISFSVGSNPAEAGEASAKVAEFCENAGFTPRVTMMIPLAVEEMLAMIIEKRTRQKVLSISVRLYFLEGIIILRIRNGGARFDPVDYYRKNISSDLEKSLEVIGVKYVVETADVVYYRQTFGVNNLVVIWGKG